MEEELSFVKCLNQKEAIEYELQLKKLIMNAIKRFQQGQDPKKCDLELNLVYPMMVHDVKVLVKTMYKNVAKANRKDTIKTVTNTDGTVHLGPRNHGPG